MEKRALILNPQSSGVAAALDELRHAAAEFGCDWYEVPDVAELGRTLERLRQEGYRRLLIGGGDGTISRVVNQLATDWSHFELAIVPLGTGNDLARSLGLPIDDIALAVRMGCEHPAQRMDVVRLERETSRYYVNAACGGFGGEMARDIQGTDKQRWGAFAYWMTAISKMVSLSSYEVELDVDGIPRRQAVYGVTVANGRFVGGGFPIASNAALNDGILDVVVIPALPILELLTAGLDLMIDTWYLPEQVELIPARNVHIRSQPEMLFSVDGEPKRAVDVTFEILPRVLPIVPGDPPEGAFLKINSG